MSRVTRREWYRRVNAAWPATVPPITNDEAIRAARKLYRFARGRTWTGEVRIVTGNRNTWVRGGVLVVNPSQGWKEIVHLLSHYCYRPVDGERPHGPGHARAEMRMIREVIRRDWLSGVLKSPDPIETPAPTADDKRAAKITNLRDRLARWEGKRKRADNAIAKIRRSLRAYDRQKPATAKYPARPCSGMAGEVMGAGMATTAAEIGVS